MLEINQESVLSELKSIEDCLDNASFEDCIDTLQKLTNSMIFLVEERVEGFTNSQWNNYCIDKYKLGIKFVYLIHLYNEKLVYYLNKRCTQIQQEEMYNEIVDRTSKIVVNDINNNGQLNPPNIPPKPMPTKSTSLSVNLNGRPSSMLQLSIPKSPSLSQLDYPKSPIQSQLTIPTNSQGINQFNYSARSPRLSQTIYSAKSPRFSQPIISIKSPVIPQAKLPDPVINRTDTSTTTNTSSSSNDYFGATIESSNSVNEYRNTNYNRNTGMATPGFERDGYSNNGNNFNTIYGSNNNNGNSSNRGIYNDNYNNRNYNNEPKRTNNNYVESYNAPGNSSSSSSNIQYANNYNNANDGYNNYYTNDNYSNIDGIQYNNTNNNGYEYGNSSNQNFDGNRAVNGGDQNSYYIVHNGTFRNANNENPNEYYINHSSSINSNNNENSSISNNNNNNNNNNSNYYLRNENNYLNNNNMNRNSTMYNGSTSNNNNNNSNNTNQNNNYDYNGNDDFTRYNQQQTQAHRQSRSQSYSQSHTQTPSQSQYQRQSSQPIQSLQPLQPETQEQPSPSDQPSSSEPLGQPSQSETYEQPIQQREIYEPSSQPQPTQQSEVYEPSSQSQSLTTQSEQLEQPSQSEPEPQSPLLPIYESVEHQQSLSTENSSRYNDDMNYATTSSDMINNEVESDNEFSNNPQSLNDEASEDTIIGKYVCIKEYVASEDFQIDLQVGDIVTLNQLTGAFVLGQNCRTNSQGIFPIYNIDSLEGRNIFYRASQDMEFASMNDDIFILSEEDTGYLPGYNITKGEQGIFDLSGLISITFDDRQSPNMEETSTIEREQSLVSSAVSRTESINTSLTSANSINSQNLNSQNINSQNLNSQNINSQNINSQNLNSQNLSSQNCERYADPVHVDDNSCIGPLQPSLAPTDAMSVTIDDQINEIAVQSIDEDKIDQNIAKKLLDYYKCITDLQDENNKDDGKNDVNLRLMREAVNKFQKMRNITDQKKIDNMNLTTVFQDPEVKRRKREKNKYRCQELCETEKNYCDQLKIMIDKIMKPMEEAVDTNNEMLNRIQISLIFKNIPEIYEFSLKLYEELDEALNSYDEEGSLPIARVFLKRFGEWKIYIKYIEDFQRANETIENIANFVQGERYQRFMEQCRKAKAISRCTIKEFLILPIQHFLRYRLFFEGIKKDSDPMEIESYQLLDTVDNFIFELSEIMNIAKKVQDNIDKMFSVEKAVLNYPPDLISYTQRSFVGEWEIIDIKPKMLYLFSDTVLFAGILNKKSKKNKRYKYIFDRRINIMEFEIVQDSSWKRYIKFKTGNQNSTEVEKTNSMGSIHGHNLLGFSINHSGSSPITKSVISFKDEEACKDFTQKYNLQKQILARKREKTIQRRNENLFKNNTIV